MEWHWLALRSCWGIFKNPEIIPRLPSIPGFLVTYVNYIWEGTDANEDESDESDPDFEEESVDVSDNEELVDGTDIEEGFQAIMNKHMKRLYKQLDIITETETEEGVIPEE